MVQYRTVSGDTWDLIAYRGYGKYGGEKLMSALMDANPSEIETVIFSAGVLLEIPKADIPSPKTLPPWIGG